MSTVMFATRCDHCEEKSEEYTWWPQCRECLADTCFDCDIESQRDEETNRTLCRDCAARIIA